MVTTAITPQTIIPVQSKLEGVAFLYFNNIKTSSYDICLKEIVPNCKVFDDFDKCKECEDNNVLTDDFMCESYPVSKISNCQEYTTSTICKKCQNQYYLNDDNTACLESITIPHCQNYYYNTANSCEQCVFTHYRDSGSCLERQFSFIENCVEYLIDHDGCALCDIGYEPSGNTQICLNKIHNCLEYSKSAEEFVCSICGDGFFLENPTTCSNGLLDGCKRYHSENQCAVCLTGYYLEGSFCVNHSQKSLIYNCSEFSTTSNNLCNVCDKLSINYVKTGFCLPVENTVSGCRKYIDSTTCEECFSENSYLSNGECVSGTISNCEKYHLTQSQCTKCKIDFENIQSYVTFPQKENNKCYLGNPNIHYQCRSLFSEEESEKCLICETQHYSFNHVSNKLGFCVPKSFYKLHADDVSGEINIDYDKLNFCELWDYEKDICTKCKIKKVVQKNGRCGDICDENERLSTYNLDKTVNDEVFMMDYFSCTSKNEFYGTSGFKNTFNKCYRYEVESTSNIELCMDCQSSHIPSVDFDLNHGQKAFFRYIPDLLISSFSVFNAITPVSTCLSRNTSVETATSNSVTKLATIDGNIGSSFNKCRFAMKIGDDTYGCIACDFGFSGSIVQDDQKQGNFILNCLAIDSCEKNTFYNGLGTLPNQFDGPFKFPLDFYTTCHKCSGDKIPTISVLNSQIESSISNSKGLTKFFYPFDFPSASTSDLGTNTGTKGTVTSCQPNGMGNIGVSFCSIQEYSIDKPLGSISSTEGAINDTSNPLCLACIPGYYPTMSTGANNNYAVISCTGIDNCNNAESKSFNKCDICSGKYSLKYDSTASNKMTNGTECIYAGQENCLVYDQILTQCVKCAKGYILNSDFVCDSVDSFQCEEYGYYTKDIKEVTNHYSLVGHGCLKCSGDNIAMRFSDILSTCVLSQSLSPGSENTSNFLINNCTYYGVNDESEIICAQCNEISISSEDRKSCFIIPNTLEDCLMVVNNSTSDNIKCQVCQDYYYRDDFNYCIKGNIQNCIQYNSSNDCRVCQKGYFRTQIQNGNIICMKPNTQPCNIYNSSSALIGVLQCDLCESNYYHTTSSEFANFPIVDCLKIPEIEHCLEYNNSGGILNSDLSCIKCESDYFVSSPLVCSGRTKNSILNCIEKNVSKDECGVCNIGYFVNDAGDCEPYPTGVINCIEYTSSTQCSKCAKDYYLESNECKKTSQLVRDCVYYKADKTCLECRPNFFLESNECQLGNAINCLVYKNRNECENCPSGYGLIPDGNKLSCIEILIDNCAVPDENSIGPNFKCLQCNVSFYVNEQFTCTAVPEQIEFCGIYETADTCALCFNNYVLVSNKKKCVLSTEIEKFIDINCLNSFISASPICNLCTFGFYFEVDADALLIDDSSSTLSSSKLDSSSLPVHESSVFSKVGLLKDEFENESNRKCVPCPQADNSCALCYPKNPKFCMICAPSYTHDSEGFCTKTFPDDETDDSNQFAGILNIRTILLLIIVIILPDLFG